MASDKDSNNDGDNDGDDQALNLVKNKAMPVWPCLL